MVDIRVWLCVFEEGYVYFLVCVNVGFEEIWDSIVVGVCYLDDFLECYLIWWWWIYGIWGEVECEGCLVWFFIIVREVVFCDCVDGCELLCVYVVVELIEWDIFVYKIRV